MAYIDQYTIRQGAITLYRRDGEGRKYKSEYWYAAFKIPGMKAIRKSLKVLSRHDAEIIAEEMYFDLIQKSRRGLSLSKKSFKNVAAAYLADLEKKVNAESNLEQARQRYKSSLLNQKKHIVEKYLNAFFESKVIQDISDYDVEDFKHWRKTYWTSGEGSKIKLVEYDRDGRKVRRRKTRREMTEPNWNTVNKELTTLRQIFEFARLKRLISDKEIPTIKNVSKPRQQDKLRPSLSDVEVKHLLNTLVSRYKSQTNPKHKRSHKLLIHYISWMCLTGMRVSEAKNLKIKDCKIYDKLGKEYLRVFVHGKGKSRELIALDEAITVLNKLIYLHKSNAKLHGWRFNTDLPLFIDQYGKQVNSFSKSLDRALLDADLLHDVYKSKRSAGSFRKYYITHALLIGNINYFELAKQCGTSVGVIEKYYASIDVTMRPEQFIFTNALSGVYDDNPANVYSE